MRSYLKIRKIRKHKKKEKKRKSFSMQKLQKWQVLEFSKTEVSCFYLCPCSFTAFCLSNVYGNFNYYFQYPFLSLDNSGHEASHNIAVIKVSICFTVG